MNRAAGAGVTVDMTRRTAYRTAYRAAGLFDGVSSTLVPDPTVIVEGSRIAAVLPAGEPVPHDAEPVDLPGTTLVPGLVDTHVHLVFDGSTDPIGALAARDDDAALDAMQAAAQAQLRAGVTTLRDLGDRAYLALHLRETSAAHLPTILAAGPPITTPGGHCHFLGGSTSGLAGVRGAVRERAERGVDVIKVMASGGEMTAGSRSHEAQFTPDELRALVEEAHALGLPVTAHAHAVDGIRHAIDAGVDGIEHCTFRTADGIETVDALVDALAAAQVAIGVTGGLLPGIPVPAAFAGLVPALRAVVGRLAATGCLLVLGSDAGVGPLKPHGIQPFGVQQLVEFGLTPLAALRAATSVAAAVCGVGDRKGRIAAGFDADLIAVPGDPLADLGLLQRPVAVVAGGRAVELGAPQGWSAQG